MNKERKKERKGKRCNDAPFKVGHFDSLSWWSVFFGRMIFAESNDIEIRRTYYYRNHYHYCYCFGSASRDRTWQPPSPSFAFHCADSEATSLRAQLAVKRQSITGNDSPRTKRAGRARRLLHGKWSAEPSTSFCREVLRRRGVDDNTEAGRNRSNPEVDR